MIKGDGQISDIFKSYLYGDLEFAERDDLEDRLFADAALAELLEDFENDLVDSYIRGELTVTEKDEFETRYLVSESHREKVTVARILHDKLVAATRPRASVVADSAPGFWTAIVHAWQNRGVALASGLAAALLVGILGTWLYFQVSDDRLAKTDNSSTIVNTNASPGVVETDNLNGVTTLNDDRNGEDGSPELPPSVSPPAPANEADKRRNQTRVFAFTLLPVTRGADRPVFAIPPAADTVLITLVHDDQREFRRFMVELRPNGGEVTWKRDVRASGRRGSNAVVVRIPAAALRSGNYELGLAGVTRDAVTEDLKFYQFSVKK
jgi:hypothetical protein